VPLPDTCVPGKSPDLTGPQNDLCSSITKRNGLSASDERSVGLSAGEFFADRNFDATHRAHLEPHLMAAPTRPTTKTMLVKIACQELATATIRFHSSGSSESMDLGRACQTALPVRPRSTMCRSLHGPGGDGCFFESGGRRKQTGPGRGDRHRIKPHLLPRFHCQNL
jgi:hypothetical protein